MQTVFRNARFVLPVAFFGYAAVVNLGFAEFAGPKSLASADALLKGEVTANLDSVYRKSLPHREPAIGVIGAIRYLAVGEGRKGVVAGEDGWLFTAEEIRVMPEPLAVPLERVAGLRDRLAEAGVTLVLVPVPGKLDVYADEASLAEAQAITALYDGFLAGLEKAEIPALDTRATLRTVAADRPAFFRTDTHWTTDGARAVAEGLAASGLLPKGEDAFDVLPEKPRSFTGDLVSFVTTDSIAPYLGLAPEEATPYTATLRADGDAVDIFGGAATGGTVLVGTSYSANPTWSFAEALKIALGTDVINFAEEGQGPVRPMLSYLASDSFRDAPPTVVIWEFPVRYLSDPAIWEPKAREEAKSGA
ncbi:MAG: hypothetical protein HC844_06575 [Tabrizicola sp.]|nr:hypothetical protein [Tabrizicola sp.]